MLFGSATKLLKRFRNKVCNPTKYSTDEGKYLIAVLVKLMCAKLSAGSKISGKILSIELQLRFELYN
jgi:hypothetical protein